MFSTPRRGCCNNLDVTANRLIHPLRVLAHCSSGGEESNVWQRRLQHGGVRDNDDNAAIAANREDKEFWCLQGIHKN